VEELKGHANKEIIICLVGNKLDLVASREVSTDQAKEFAAEQGLLFMEASAKTGEAVVDIFNEICTKWFNLAKKIPLETISQNRARTGLNQGSNRVNMNSNPGGKNAMCC
jgi:GTPase SAR1 family protein